MRARATQRSRVATAHRERSDLSNSSTDPGFAFECLSPRRAIFDTVNALPRSQASPLTLSVVSGVIVAYTWTRGRTWATKRQRLYNFFVALEVDDRCRFGSLSVHERELHNNAHARTATPTRCLPHVYLT